MVLWGLFFFQYFIISLLLPLTKVFALTPLPLVNKVSAPTARSSLLDSIRIIAIKALGEAQRNNVSLCEIEFPPLLGEKNEFADVDNVQILNRNRDWSMLTASELANEYGEALWLAFPDRKELELATEAWPGRAYQKCTLTTIEDAASVLAGKEQVAQPWGAQFSRFFEKQITQEGAILGARPETASAPPPKLIFAVQPGDGGPLEDWLNLEQCELNDGFLISCNGAFDKLRGGYYPPIIFPKLASCVDRFISRFETLLYLKSLNEKGRGGWIFRVYPEDWQVHLQDRAGGNTLLVLQSATRPTYQEAVDALLRGKPVVSSSASF
uniref:DUF1995 domain-containing protein n=1 Tax=Aureoumbra lagunensis TaxID=44058 RepID=A0A7S3JY64_9STRA|mmetsp:Transcript_9669/g.13421  ORF Transcript_9669/g.13421 Transcript_9669/m.13421 type:complete len:325 (-) Transcript_9669:53-1027(-)